MEDYEELVIKILPDTYHYLNQLQFGYSLEINKTLSNGKIRLLASRYALGYEELCSLVNEKIKKKFRKETPRPLDETFPKGLIGYKAYQIDLLTRVFRADVLNTWMKWTEDLAVYGWKFHDRVGGTGLEATVIYRRAAEPIRPAKTAGSPT